MGGGASTTLTVPLWSELCDMVVMAKIRARQQTDCGSSKWEMNAVRDASNCGHFLLLDLSPSDVNPWMMNQPQKKCKFVTKSCSPVKINCHSWQNSSPGPVIGSMVLTMEAQF
jgi:hypothetical protein